jgi:hypothetical protein
VEPAVALGFWYDEAHTRWVKTAVVAVAVAVAEQLSARSENPADEASVIYPDSAALLGPSRVQEHIVAKMSQKRPQPVATLEMDATIIESHKQEALPHYKGGRGYQPSLVYWVEQDLVVSHARRLCARVARSLLERADLLLGRARLRTAWAA